MWEVCRGKEIYPRRFAFWMNALLAMIDTGQFNVNETRFDAFLNASLSIVLIVWGRIILDAQHTMNVPLEMISIFVFVWGRIILDPLFES